MFRLEPQSVFVLLRVMLWPSWGKGLGYKHGNEPQWSLQLRYAIFPPMFMSVYLCVCLCTISEFLELIEIRKGTRSVEL